MNRKQLLPERKGITWKLIIGKPDKEFDSPDSSSHIKAFVSTGEYKDGTLGEVFITLDKEGSMLKGLLNGFSIILSVALQYGIPLEVIAKKFINMRFCPSGLTNDSSVPVATSFFDLLFRKLALKYLDKECLEELGIQDLQEKSSD